MPTNLQPSLTITRYVALNGAFPSPNSGGGDMTLGMIRMFGGTFVPGEDDFAQGQVLPTGNYDMLFQVYGATYGGNGQTTFALPNLSGRPSVSLGQGPGLPSHTLGQAFGTSDFAAFTQANMPASSGGTSAPVDNNQPTLTTQYLIRLFGGFNEGPSTLSMGEIVEFGGNFVPRGYAACNGQLLPINQNQALFAILGTAFGGNGQTNFALPDLRGRIPVGTGSGVALGQQLGSVSTAITQAQMPVGYGGTGEPVGNQQPSLGLTYLIATTGNFPPRDSGGSPSDGHYLGEIILFAGNPTGMLQNGWALCDGGLIAISQSTAGLFSILGTSYGGNGQTTFALPNLQGRAAVGSGVLDGVTRVVGETFGVNTITIAPTDIPPLDIAGTPAADTFFGGTFNDKINGAAGADTMNGGPGKDTLTGGTGADRFVLGAASHSPSSALCDEIFDFETGVDRLDLTALGANARLTTVQGGATTFVYADVEGDGVRDALVIAVGQALTGADIDTVSTFGVTMFGDGGVNSLVGSARGDLLIAGDGADSLRGGAGADQFYGQGGADTVVLGVGDSTPSAIDVALDFVSGTDRIDVAAVVAAGGRLTLARFGGSGFLYIDQNGDGTADGQLLAYQALIQGSDLIGAGGLTIYGSGQDDALIRGGGSVDVIAGFDGADVIVGGAGADQLYGGAGADQFRYEGLADSGMALGTYDFIQDFQVGVDKLDLRALNTSASSTFTRQSFGGATFVYVDQDGNGTQDFVVIAAGVTLSDADIRWTAGSAPEGADDSGPIVCVAPNESEFAWMM